MEDSVWLECGGEEIRLGTVEQVLDPSYVEDVRAGACPNNGPGTTTHAINLFISDVLSMMKDEDSEETDITVSIRH